MVSASSPCSCKNKAGVKSGTDDAERTKTRSLGRKTLARIDGWMREGWRLMVQGGMLREELCVFIAAEVFIAA